MIDFYGGEFSTIEWYWFWLKLIKTSPAHLAGVDLYWFRLKLIGTASGRILPHGITLIFISIDIDFDWKSIEFGGPENGLTYFYWFSYRVILILIENRLSWVVAILLPPFSIDFHINWYCFNWKSFELGGSLKRYPPKYIEISCLGLVGFPTNRLNSYLKENQSGFTWEDSPR